jgi:type II secretory pathway pseudopilin PulG
MSRTILNTVLTLIFLGLVYVLAQMISEPIQFQNQKDKRERAVATQLKKIRTAQRAYRSITGKYAADFDTLSDVLTNAQFKIETVIGDIDAGEEVTRTETFVNAIDSMTTLGINTSADSLSYVPYGSTGAKFEMKSAEIEYQSTTVQVVQVKIPWKDFMGDYANPRYSVYDPTYNTTNASEKNYYLKFGDLNKPTLNANWRKFGKATGDEE